MAENNLIEIQFIGSGGQGAVIAAKLLAHAAAVAGYKCQSFASYGALRRGGRVDSYVRISESEVLIHCKMYEPDYLVIMDESFVDSTEGLPKVKSGGAILINSNHSPDSFSSLGDLKIVTINADRIAKEQGVVLPNGVPIINTTVLGATVALLSIIDINQIALAIKDGKIPDPEKNIKAAREGWCEITDVGKKITISKQGESQKKSPELYPVYNYEKMVNCHKCMLCYMLCSSLAITLKKNPFSLSINNGLCARCGVCIEECPKKIISLGVEN